MEKKKFNAEFPLLVPKVTLDVDATASATASTASATTSAKATASAATALPALGTSSQSAESSANEEGVRKERRVSFGTIEFSEASSYMPDYSTDDVSLDGETDQCRKESTDTY